MHAFLAVCLLLHATVPSTGDPGRQDPLPVPEALSRLAAIDPVHTPAERLVELVTDCAAALGEEPAVAAALAAGLLRDHAAGAGRPAADGASIDQLTEAMARARTARRPELLLPAALVLTQLAGADPRGHLLLAEALGAASPIRDPGRAAAALDRALQLLAAPGPSSSPTLAGVLPLLAEGEPTLPPASLQAWLRAQRAALDEGVPLRPTGADELRALGLMPELAAARRGGDQRSALRLLTQCARLLPGNPAFALLLGETLASVGPLPQPDLAQRELQRFLRLTDPTPGPVAELRLCLELAGVAWPATGLAGLRDHAREILDQLRTPGTRILYSPDREHLQGLVRALEVRRQRRQRERDAAQVDLRNAETDYRQACDAYERARRAPVRPGSFRTNLDALYSRVQDARENVDNRRKRLAALTRQHDELATQIAAGTARLRRFTAADR